MSAQRWVSILCFLASAASAEPQASNLGALSPATQEVLKEWWVPIPKALEEETDLLARLSKRETPWTLPGTSLLSPVGFGAAWGDVFAVFSIAQRARFNQLPDARFGLGFGIGNPWKWVGIEVSYSMFDVSAVLPWNSEGAFGVKVHRLFRGGFGVALGIDNIVQWGGDSGRSYYGVVSKAFFLSSSEEDFFSSIFLHFGLGDGNFQREADLIAGVRKLNWFASAGVRIFRPASFVVNWYGSELGVGLSIAPFRKHRVTLTPCLLDLAGTAGDGPRFMASLAYGIDFR